MPYKRKTYKRKRTYKPKKRYVKKKQSTRYRKKGGPRVNIPSTGLYNGSETITLGTGFVTPTYTATNYRFDAVALPRFTALAPEFKWFKFNKATLRVVPRVNSQAWYNITSTGLNGGNQGKQFVTWIKKDGEKSFLPTDLSEARNLPNSRLHSMQKTMRRSFVPWVIKINRMVSSDVNDTKDMVQFCNPWLDTKDADSYLVDRTAIGLYSPPLLGTNNQVVEIGYDVYLDVKYTLKGVQHLTPDPPQKKINICKC